MTNYRQLLCAVIPGICLAFAIAFGAALPTQGENSTSISIAKQ